MADALDSQTLLSAARAGDNSSLGRLCDELRPRLRFVAARGLGKLLTAKVDASDVVQVALLEATRAFPKFRGQTIQEFEGWVAEIVKNEAYNFRRHWKRKRRNVQREEGPANAAGGTDLHAGEESTPSAKVARHEFAIAVRQFIDRLPPEEKRVVYLRHLEDKTLAEISSLIDRSPDAAAGLLKRAMKRLRGLMRGANH